MALLDIIGWIGVVFLMFSGPLQAVKNLRRKSTEGLSRMMYICIFFGTGGLAFVAWFKGAGLPVCTQYASSALGAAIILFQMWWYRPHKYIHIFRRYIMRNHHKEPMKEEKDDNAHTVHH